MISLPNLAWAKGFHSRLYESLVSIRDGLRLVAQETGVSGNPLDTPPKISQLQVTASNGFFSIAIIDPAGTQQPNLGLHYFLQYSVDAGFTQSQQLPEQTSRNATIFLGNLTLFWRVASQFRNSSLSPWVYLGGTTPTSITGGSASSPTLPPSQGGGSGGGGGGFGRTGRFSN